MNAGFVLSPGLGVRFKGDSNPGAGTAWIPPVRRVIGLSLREGALRSEAVDGPQSKTTRRRFVPGAVLPTIGMCPRNCSGFTPDYTGTRTSER